MRKYLLPIAAVAALSVAGAASADNYAAANSGSNLATNGTLAAGNTGFGTDYNYADPSMVGYSQYPETQYMITTNTSLVRPDMAWGSYGGPEAGQNIMVVNGATSLNPDSSLRNFWKESINVTAGTTYTLSFDAASLYADPATVQLTINGGTVGSTISLNGASGAWATESFSWTASAPGSVTFGLTDTNKDAGGNDFAVTNFSISAAPEPAAWALMMLGVGGMGAALRARRRAVAA